MFTYKKQSLTQFARRVTEIYKKLKINFPFSCISTAGACMRMANNSEVLVRNFTVYDIPSCRMAIPMIRMVAPMIRMMIPSYRIVAPSTRSRRPSRRSRQTQDGESFRPDGMSFRVVGAAVRVVGVGKGGGFYGGVAAFYCEIPAFAGMNYLGTGNCWRILADCCRHDTVRFLPSQEWSVEGTQESAANRRIVAHDTVRFLLSQEWSRE